MPARIDWTSEEIDKLIYLYNNHTNPYIFENMKKYGKSSSSVQNKIKNLKELELIDKSKRLDFETRCENDKEARNAELEGLDRDAFRNKQRLYYLFKSFAV